MGGPRVGRAFRLKFQQGSKILTLGYDGSTVDFRYEINRKGRPWVCWAAKHCYIPLPLLSLWANKGLVSLGFLDVDNPLTISFRTYIR